MNYSHGHKTKEGASKIYRIHHNIVQRCSRPTCPAFKNYGGRGIGLHPPWFDFNIFVSEIPECPDESLTLDRIDNEKGYIPGNLRWASRQEQNRNRRNTKMLTYKRECKPMAQWAEERGINYMTLKTRIASGWSVSHALNHPVKKSRRGLG